jgi:hypothetical protein
MKSTSLLRNLERKFGKRPCLNTFWHGGALGWPERACLKSMVVHGHCVKLFAYESIENVPDGVTICDANAVLPKISMFKFDGVFGDNNIGSIAPFSDYFRYHLLQQTDGIWVDCDVYLLKPLRFFRRHVFAWESETIIGIGILGLPRNSTVLKTLLNIMSSPLEMPPWVSDKIQKAALEKLNGCPLHLGALRYATYGPPAITWALKKLGKSQRALPRALFYPVHFNKFEDLCLPADKLVSQFGSDVLSVHLYSSILRRKIKGRPPLGSFLDRIWNEGIKYTAATAKPERCDVR